MARTLCESWPGSITFITEATSSTVGLVNRSSDSLTEFWTSGSRVVRMRYPPRSICSRDRPEFSRYCSAYSQK